MPANLSPTDKLILEVLLKWFDDLHADWYNAVDGKRDLLRHEINCLLRAIGDLDPKTRDEIGGLLERQDA